MATPTPLPSGAPQTPSPSLLPLPTPLQGEEAGFCGLTSEQWRLVSIFVVIPCEFWLTCRFFVDLSSAHAFRPNLRFSQCYSPSSLSSLYHGSMRRISPFYGSERRSALRRSGRVRSFRSLYLVLHMESKPSHPHKTYLRVARKAVRTPPFGERRPHHHAWRQHYSAPLPPR